MNQSVSAFDPQSFLDAQISEPTVKRPPIPAGDYTAVIGEIKARVWQGRKDPTMSGIAWDVPLAIEIPAAVQAALGVEFKDGILTKTDSIMIDTTPQGTIDNSVGKNGQLRRYRDACDMNKSGDVFSARKMQGIPVLVKIKHGEWNGEVTEEIAGVAKL